MGGKEEGMKLKRIVAILLIIVLNLSCVSFVYADTTSTPENIISAYISMAKSDSSTDLDFGNLDFTKDQLRFLGVYCSNFFTPFGTELGEAAGEDTQNSIDAFAKALQTGLKFNESYAQIFAENIIGLSRGNIKELEFRVSKSYQTGYQRVEDIDPGISLNSNYYLFLTTMLGGFRTYFYRYVSRDESFYSQSLIDKFTTSSDKPNYGYWGYAGTNGSFVPVFDCVLQPKARKEMTASQFAFLKCFEATENNKGYGLYTFDFTRQELEGDDFPLQDGYTNEEIYNMSIFGSRMLVDCFGNIIIDGGQHDVVAVPGCMNPYNWVTVDRTGTDTANAGKTFNAVNFNSMSELDRGTADRGLAEGIGNVYDSDSTDSSFSTPNNYIKEHDFGDVTDMSTADRNACKNAIINLAGRIDNVYGSSYWSVEFKDVVGRTHIFLRAHTSAWGSCNLDKLNNNYDWGTNEEAKESVRNSFAECSSRGLSRNHITVMFDRGVTKIKGGDRTSNSNVMTKEIFTNLGKLMKLLNTDEDDDGLKNGTTNGDAGSQLIPLKRYRGTALSNLDDSPLWWSDGYDDALEKALVHDNQEYPKDVSSDVDWVQNWETYANYAYTAHGLGQLNTDSFGVFTVPIVDSIITIDNLGIFDTAYDTYPVVNYIKADGGTINGSTIDMSFGSGSCFSAGFTNMINGTMEVRDDVSDTAILSVYCSYLFSSLYSSSDMDKANTIGKLGYRMSTDVMPAILAEPLSLPQSAREDLMSTSIKGWLYYLLNPTEGLSYTKTLIKNKVNSVMLGWHNDMLGTNGVGATTGTTYYRPSTGYVTTPDLSEMQWTDSLINFYNEAIPFIIIIMLVTMVFAFITGVLTFQRSLLGLILFSGFLLLPVNLINAVVGVSNNITQKLYGEKFTYWALVQQETYSSAIDAAAESGSYQNYLQTLYNVNSQTYSSQGSESIMLKWQAPKKMASLMNSGDSYNSLSSGGQQLLNALVSKSFTGQGYLDNDDAIYMYRSYIDISNFSRYIYKGLKEGNRGTFTRTQIKTDKWDSNLKSAWSTISTTYRKAIDSGYNNKNGDNSTSVDKAQRIIVPLSSRIINSALGKKGKVKNLVELDDFVGINQNMFNFSIPFFQTSTRSQSIKDLLLQNLDNSTSEERTRLTSDLGTYNDKDFSGLAAYGLFSENVFYYFSWGLYDQGLSTSGLAYGGYRNLLLKDEDGGYFYNTKGNGELKDFMDMRSLFTYVIPYLKSCNDLVREWDKLYGIYINEGVPTEEGHWNDEGIKNNAEMKQKYWHNLNVARLYGMYTPWVDIMYECSYAEPEKIDVLGEKKVVSNPLDPSTYPSSRPMIFSKSEMLDYGLSNGDLTEVERKILDCNEGMEERMYELLNYLNFNDVTLNTAAAINCAFEFNSVFSEVGIFSDNHNIYPQSFELADFSYDAFLRFILSNNVGEDISYQGDFYENIVNHSSFTAPLVMIILDVLSVYVIPFAKIFFIMGIFIASILIILITAFKIEAEQKFVKRVFSGFIVPMVYFFLATLGFAFLISLFMGVGNNAVTQTTSVSIQLGDPVIAMLAMIVLDIVIIIIYFKIIKGVMRNVKSYGKEVGGFLGGIAVGTLGMAKGAISNIKNRGNSSGNSSGKGSNYATEGTGVASSRAMKRGNKDNIDSYEEADNSTRKNDTKKETIKNINTETNEKKEKEKEDKVNEAIEKGVHRINRAVGRGSGREDNTTKDDSGGRNSRK